MPKPNNDNKQITKTNKNSAVSLFHLISSGNELRNEMIRIHGFFEFTQLVALKQTTNEMVILLSNCHVFNVLSVVKHCDVPLT